MSFQNPGMFWWLFALAIPVIVHLFNFRKHKLLMFSNIELLKNLQEQTNRKRNIKHLIVLALRMLMIAGLVTAFAKPFIPSKNNLSSESENLISVYLDNSMSMQLRGNEMSMLDEARQNAVSIIQSFGMNNRFVLLTNDFLPQHQRSMSPVEFIQELEQVRGGAQPALFSDVIARNKTIPQTEAYEDRMLFALSDFQKSIFDTETIVSDSNLNLVLMHSESAQKNNLYIDSCWFETPALQLGMNATLITRIANSGAEEAVGIPVKLEIDGEQKAIANVDIAPGSSVEARLQFVASKAGHFEGTVSILDFPIVFDDELYFSFEIQSKIKVLEIFEKQSNPWLNILFTEDELVTYESHQKLRLDIQSLPDYQLIFINGLSEIHSGLKQALSDFVQRGGSLVLLPGNENADAFNELSIDFGFSYSARADTADTRVFKIEESHSLFREVFVKIPENADFPVVFQHYPIQMQQRSTAMSLIRLLNGNPFLVVNDAGLGKVFAFAVPFAAGWSDFQRNSLFVPVLYRLVLMSARPGMLYYTLGKEVVIESAFTDPENATLLKLKSFTTDFEIIPEFRTSGGRQEVVIHPDIPTAGQYGFFAGDSLTRIISFNNDRKESVMTFYKPDELQRLFEFAGFKTLEVLSSSGTEMTDAFKDLIAGKQWYKLFILLALLFILAEVLILRFWK
jgi:hypothetical protein